MSNNNNLTKQQTAMMELLSIISGVLEYSQNPLLQQILDAGNNLLQKEQQQIEKAVLHGNLLDGYDITETCGTRYYNETYGSEQSS